MRATSLFSPVKRLSLSKQPADPLLPPKMTAPSFPARLIKAKQNHPTHKQFNSSLKNPASMKINSINSILMSSTTKVV